MKFGAEPRLTTGTGNDQTTGNGNHERRDHGDQTIADGEYGVGLERLAEIHSVLQYTDEEAGDDVDGGDENAGHGVALSEARGAVHGAVKFRFRGEGLA